jgi:hypothetical protein
MMDMPVTQKSRIGLHNYTAYNFVLVFFFLVTDYVFIRFKPNCRRTFRKSSQAMAAVVCEDSISLCTCQV